MDNNFFIAGNIAAHDQTRGSLFTAQDFASAMHAETARFLRIQQRADAGLLGLENLVLFGSLSLDAVVAPLSFPSLLIREPRCLQEQRRGDATCQ